MFQLRTTISTGVGVLLCALALPAAAQSGGTARVSDVTGHLAVHGSQESAVSYLERNGIVQPHDTLWTDQRGNAELELDRGAWVRLSEGTKVDALGLSGEREFRVWSGSVYFQSRPGGQPAIFRTPQCDVEVAPGSVARMDLTPDGRGRISVYGGTARVLVDGGDPATLGAGSRLYVANGRLQGAAARFDSRDLDGFDRYEASRAGYYAGHPLDPHLKGDLIGAGELAGNGTWVTYRGGSYWHPRYRPGWRPYSNGYWSYVAGRGHVWIDYEPWGYCTSHYGRWVFVPDVGGWCWRPAYAWAPAHVAWVRYGDYCGWAPLDPFDHPCAGPGVSVGVSLNFGGFHVGLDYRSWSFVPYDNFFYCRTAYVSGPAYRTVNDIHITNVTVNRVTVVNNVYSGIGVPSRAVRGLAVARDGVVARTTVVNTERGIPAGNRRLAQNRFRVPATRDLALAQKASPVETWQRNRSTKIGAAQVARGDAGAHQFKAAVAAVSRPVPHPIAGSFGKHPAALPGGRDRAFTKGAIAGHPSGAAPAHPGMPGLKPGAAGHVAGGPAKGGHLQPSSFPHGNGPHAPAPAHPAKGPHLSTGAHAAPAAAGAHAAPKPSLAHGHPVAKPISPAHQPGVQKASPAALGKGHNAGLVPGKPHSGAAAHAKGGSFSPGAHGGKGAGHAVIKGNAHAQPRGSFAVPAGGKHGGGGGSFGRPHGGDHPRSAGGGGHAGPHGGGERGAGGGHHGGGGNGGGGGHNGGGGGHNGGGGKHRG